MEHSSAQPAGNLFGRLTSIAVRFVFGMWKMGHASALLLAIWQPLEPLRFQRRKKTFLLVEAGEYFSTESCFLAEGLF
jgi:hypothetical protein